MRMRPGMKIYNFLVKAFSLGKDYLKRLKKGLEEYVWLQQNYNKYQAMFCFVIETHRKT